MKIACVLLFIAISMIGGASGNKGRKSGRRSSPIKRAIMGGRTRGMR